MKKRCKRRSTVYHQVVGLLCLIMLVTTAVPTVMFSHFSRRAFAGDVQNQVLSSIDTVADYLEQHHLPLSDIDELLSFERLRLRILDDLSPLELDKEEQRRLAADGYLVFSRTSGNGLPHAMLNRYKDSYILVQADMEPIFRLSRQTKLLSLLLTLLIGLIAAMIGGYRLLVPVRMLDEATRKVAAGDFTVRIPAPKRMDEIGSLIESFNTMTRELGSVEMLRSNFVSDISHEFKTPLTAIEGYAKLLEGDCSPEERREYVGTITDETRRLSVLVANILMINRLDKGNIPSERHPVRIDEQIRHALALCEAGWTGKNLELDLELDEIYFAGYESLLMQVWANLIDNAVKFSPDGGRISLALHQKGERVVFVICNDGDNIPEESRPHLFEQFYKADPSRGGEGNGLGLSIVKRVAELHGGEASVENLPGSGVRFTIFL
ncbi:HAMP domain-containing sensor histidine kinase [Anaerotruncus sp. 1XD42-93]|uniref:HAMP domain-containing sensor histidine kinase n=1 Tax=Anaerotruncus sp. 1XD42-93 TaxID=2320853 RepID=UPI000EA0F9C1|nr:HAMP domain-containing sensor histidine kinase [Anaerotruncus sp. 1XD42-93]NBK17997.1 sensor histidine kinase [Anaerotruncus sp. 1XD42-93]RKJ93693.1 sensor histidine kinase [Anaerotruncus sp. 1XD22-93]